MLAGFDTFLRLPFVDLSLRATAVSFSFLLDETRNTEPTVFDEPVGQGTEALDAIHLMHVDDIPGGFDIHISITFIKLWPAISAESTLTRPAGKKSSSDALDREVA